MKRKQSHILTAVLVDYDNIYLALRRKSEEAAKRFAKDAGRWLKEIESGGLITPTNSTFSDTPRRIVLNRCYGNPVPRRNTHDNSTDMFSFPFVRHHFLRSGFEVVDCPPLTAQLKNSSDIRMVMDVRDFLLHDTYFDEFIILSGDADFTPVLHRLRAHARRTAIFANDHTAVPYKAISDGEIRESDLIGVLLGDAVKEPAVAAPASAPAAIQNDGQRLEGQRLAIIGEAMSAIGASRHPIPIDLLAERVIRMLGHENTIAIGWGGAGSFRELLSRGLPDGVRISEQPPYLVQDLRRQLQAPPTRIELKAEPAESQLPPLTTPVALRPEPAPAPAPAAEPVQQYSAPQAQPAPAPLPSISDSFASHYRSPLPAMPATSSQIEPPATRAFAEPQLAAPELPPSPPQAPAQTFQPPSLAQTQAFQPPSQAPFGAPPLSPSLSRSMPDTRTAQQLQPQPPLQPPAPQPQAAHMRPAAPPPIPAPDVATATTLQQSIARIYDACQAPPLSPPEYRVLFDVMAREIGERGLAGSQTLTSIVQRAAEQGVDVRRDDVRFVLEVVSETDPWFEQGASSSLFAGRFRNFVVARCRSQGLNLSVEELDLIEAWFVAGAAPAPAQRAVPSYAPPQQQGYAQPRAGAAQQGDWRTQELPGRPVPANASGGAQPEDEFPRIVRTRLRG